MENNINQKNVFGSNIVNITYPPDRNLTEGLKQKILENLKSLDVKSVAIRFDFDQETKEFVDKIASFLREDSYTIFGDNDVRMGSGIKRGEITISKHPSDSNFAIMGVGSL